MMGTRRTIWIPLSVPLGKLIKVYQSTLPHPQRGVWTHIRAYHINLFGTSKKPGVENSTNCCLLCSILFCREELLTIYVFYLNLKMKCVSSYPIHISAMKLKLL